MSLPERSANVVLNFLRKRQDEEQVAATVPRGIRVYAIGDIHGRADLLMRLLDMVTEDAKAAPGPGQLSGISRRLRGPRAAFPPSASTS